MRSFIAMLMFVGILSSGLVATTAHADSYATGTIQYIEKVTSSSTDYADQAGYVIIGGYLYNFGGNGECSTLVSPSETVLSMLNAAALAGKTVKVHWKYMSGIRCYLGAEIRYF